MSRKFYAPMLALLFVGAALPAAGALQQEQIRTDQAPLALLVTVEANPESRQLPPRVSSTPGWSCVLSEWHAQPQFTHVAAECRTEVAPPPNADWICRNIAVEAEAQGFGSVTGTVECQGLSASCTAVAPSPGYCYAYALGTGAPPVRCWATIQGFIVNWRVQCFNDP